MNLERKCARQEKRIEALVAENTALKEENKLLKSKSSISELKMAKLDEKRKEYQEALDEVYKVMDDYRNVLHEAIEMKKEFSDKFRNFQSLTQGDIGESLGKGLLERVRNRL